MLYTCISLRSRAVLPHLCYLLVDCCPFKAYFYAIATLVQYCHRPLTHEEQSIFVMLCPNVDVALCCIMPSVARVYTHVYGGLMSSRAFALPCAEYPCTEPDRSTEGGSTKLVTKKGTTNHTACFTVKSKLLILRNAVCLMPLLCVTTRWCQ